MGEICYNIFVKNVHEKNQMCNSILLENRKKLSATRSGGIGFFFTNNWIFFTNKKFLLPNALLAIKNIAIGILVKFGKYRYLHIGEF